MKAGISFNSMKNTFLNEREILKNIKVEVMKDIIRPRSIVVMINVPRSVKITFLRKIENRTKDRVRNGTYRRSLQIESINEQSKVELDSSGMCAECRMQDEKCTIPN